MLDLYVQYFSWNPEKNRTLKQERNISFEEIIFWISEGNLIDIVEHPNHEKFGHQKIMIVNVNQYAYLVPYVENKNEIFLKTIIPSRKATKKYLSE